uniref:Uncharacterized protein n=1 Tax=Anguilla anguilla TaxID=7936 RepID=A0A0E9WR44_ANGAN
MKRFVFLWDSFDLKHFCVKRFSVVLNCSVRSVMRMRLRMLSELSEFRHLPQKYVRVRSISELESEA